MPLTETIKAIAEKLELTEEKVIAYIKIEAKKLIGVADNDIDIAKAHVETVVKEDAEKVETEVKAEV